MINVLKRIVLYTVILFLVVFAFNLFEKFKNFQDKNKKLTFWSIQLKPIYEKQINSIIAQFEKKHPDYKVVWVDIPIQEAQKRTLASILSTTPPDLINLNPEFSHILAQKNALEFFSENEVNAFHPALVSKLKYENKIYGLPFYATSSVSVYNKKIYDRCIGAEFIKSYDELFALAQKLKGCADIPVFVSSLNENDTLLKILNKYDVFAFKTEAEKENTLKVYSMLNKMYKAEYMPKDTLTINHREVIEKYMSNQALIVVAGTNFIKMIKENAPDVYRNTYIAPQLVGSNKKFDVSIMNLVIPLKSKNKTLAKEFAFMLTNEKNQLELAKLTNVLPANKNTLQNDYFKVCPSDIVEKARCESAKQLNNLIVPKAEIVDKKAISDNLNKTLEEILLNKNSSFKLIKTRIFDLFPRLNLYVK